jgi:hypothetical protein
MNRKTILLTAVTLTSAAACSQGAPTTGAEPAASAPDEATAVRGASAARRPGESHQAAYARNLARLADAGAGDAGLSHESAYDSRLPIADLDFSVVPEWTDAQVSAGFDAIRDPRWLSTKAMERRESWLYPDDGCFARAALAGQRLEADGYVRPFKLFVFGNLVVQTANAPQKEKACPPWGEVSWWYHVVPVVRVGSTVKVLDPAVEPYHALEVHEWVKRVNSGVVDGGPESGITLSVCDEYTYDPYQSCLTAKAGAESSALSDEDSYLKLEWGRQVELGRKPRKVLGDDPPWKSGDWLEFDGGKCDAGRP